MEKQYRDFKLNYLIGNLLRVGVLLSVILIAFGIILGIFRDDLSIPTTFKDSLSEENAFVRFYQELVQGKTSAFIELGILTMLFTPIMRIIFAVIGFLKEKDVLYMILSLLVLAIITLSFFLGFEH